MRPLIETTGANNEIGEVFISELQKWGGNSSS